MGVGVLMANVDYMMKKRKIFNLAELSYLSKIERSDLDRLTRTFDRHSLKTIDKLMSFFECDMKEMFDVYENNKNSIKFTQDGNFSGVVYFIKTENGLTKIGFTRDLIKRVAGLKQEHKSEMKVIGYIPTHDAPTLEKVFHRFFDNKRVQGEWFFLSDEDLEFLNVTNNGK